MTLLSIMRLMRFLLPLLSVLALFSSVSASQINAAPDATILRVTSYGDEDCVIVCPPCDGDGKCSLRQAIQRANENDKLNNRIRFDSLYFNAGFTADISLQSDLPAITKNNTWIDGSDELGTFEPIIIHPAPVNTVSFLFTIDNQDPNTGRAGRNVSITNLTIESGWDSTVLINMEGGSLLRVGSNTLRTLDTSDCTSLQDLRRGLGIKIGPQVTGGVIEPTAYIYNNTINCKNTAIRIDGNYVLVGVDPAGNPAGNVIGNSFRGNKLGIELRGSHNTIANNTINYNTTAGIYAASPARPAGITNNLIQDNNLLGNALGINLTRNAEARPISQNTIFRNTIVNSAGHGIQFAGQQVFENQIVGNRIGTDGKSQQQNGGDGIRLLNGAHRNQIGGTYANIKGNLISGNAGNGITLYGQGTSNNTITSNTIGLDESGSIAVPNLGSGILLDSGPKENLIGGTENSQRNVISGNGAAGITLSGNRTLRNEIIRNLIGTDKNGTLSLGNGDTGILVVFNAAHNTIGTATNGNVIAYNQQNGIGIGAGARNNIVQVNNIYANLADGIRIDNANDNFLFKTIIHDNAGAGIHAASGLRNTWSLVSIYGNTQLGIDLDPGGVTANDAGDGDTGSNLLQNFPALTLAQSSDRRIRGSINSAPHAAYHVEFYASPTCDPSGYGEGRRYLGFINSTTSGKGVANFTVTVAAFSTGEYISAFASDAQGNASEFSLCFQATK